jgi:hypothetical protein
MPVLGERVTKITPLLLAACLLALCGAGRALAADAEVELGSSDGSTRFAVLDGAGAEKFGVDSDGNVYAVGYSSASRFYGDGSTLDNVSTHTFKIGDAYGGGRVFWVDAKGRQVLIAAAADQSGGITWGGNGVLSGALIDAVYGGRANTVLISTTLGTGSYAAQLCENFSTTTASGEYYDDWYLPSGAELDLLCPSSASVGGFVNAYYWSSTEYNSGAASAVLAGNCSRTNFVKTNSVNVRCIRSGPYSGAGNLPSNAETVPGAAYLASTQTFSGVNTFGAVNIATLTVTGAARIARSSVTEATAEISLSPGDLGRTMAVKSATPRTVYLPAVNENNIGATVTVMKVGAAAVTVSAIDMDVIEDSSAGGSIYTSPSGPYYASITLRLAAASKWVIEDMLGTWITQ